MMKSFLSPHNTERLRRGFYAVCGLVGLAGGLLEDRLSAQQAHAILVNVQPDEAVSLTHALQSRNLSVITQPVKDSSYTGAIVVLEATEQISTETLLGLKSFVRHGGSLLIGLDRNPGILASQLAFLSPTTAWSTQANAASRPLDFSRIATGTYDVGLFGTTSQPGFTLPYYYPIRPVSAVERGIARYERYKITDADGVFAHEAGVPLWTRPLINRDWKVRLQGNDRASSPLLITGHYGAGRVAVFASGLAGNDPGLEAFWKPVIAWLTAPRPDVSNEPASGAIELPPDAATANIAANALHVTIKNPGSKPLQVQVIGRVLTWEEAFVGDSLQSIAVPAGGTVSVDLAMPQPSSTQYQALDWRRAFVIRLGVVSQSGATLLTERSVAVDFTPSTSLDLSTDNLYNITYPYPSAPGTAAITGILPRMGSPVMQYAYQPGSKIHATAVISNGIHNVAPSATVVDETEPENPSVVALNDEGAQADKGPRLAFMGYGAWVGKAGVENVLHFHFASPVTVTAVTFTGSSSLSPRNAAQHNPGAVSIECDGKTVSHDTAMDAHFDTGKGLVRLSFDPVKTTDLTVRMPWVAAIGPKNRRREPWLGEIEIEGSEQTLPSEVHGEATLVLRDAMSAVETVVAKKQVSVPPGGRVEWSEDIKLPGTNTGFYQLQLHFNGQTSSLPVLATNPSKTLESVKNLNPSNTTQLGFFVTKGYRTDFPIGTGTRGVSSNWESPDDLIWAYSHQANQVSAAVHNWPTWFYLTDSAMAHYSNGWSLFLNGENIWTAATPNLVERAKNDRNWSTSQKVEFGFGDRWDSGPSLSEMYGWQELVAFDEYLRAQGRVALNGSTRAELSIDVNNNHAAEWGVWHEQRYVETVDSLSKAFAKFGKELVISGQGIPMTSNKDAAIVARTVRGMSSDETWGMEREDVPYTTGRQLGIQAYNPEWKLGFNFVWGWDSTTIDNPSWYAAVGTTEPSRRHYYDLAWRAVVNENGEYLSSFAYGFGMNGGNAWTMATNDYQQYWNAAERFSLLYPEHPLGAGLIVSSNVIDSPQSTFFSGGGMGGATSSERLVAQYANAFQRLHEGGLDISFTGNILGMKDFHDRAPLILQDLSAINAEELDILKGLAAQGTRIAAFRGHDSLSPAVATFFGLTSDGSPAGATASEAVGDHKLLVNGNLLYIPFSTESLTAELSLQLAPILQRWLDLPIAFPEGTMGYGFVSEGRSMIVIEDWKEQARELSLRIRATSDVAHAISLNDHNTLSVKRDGKDWVVQLPVRPGDGDVVVLEQSNSTGEKK